MDDIYKNIEKYNSNKKRKLLIVFDDMIADMLSNKKLNVIVTESFIKGRKVNISLVFITQSYFAVARNIRLISTHYFVMKIPDKRELNKVHLINHQILTLKNLLIFTKKCTLKPCNFLVIDPTLASDSPLLFRKNILERM